VTNRLDRRHFLSVAGVAALAGLAGEGLAAQPAPDFLMWHSPGCGCCLEWAKRVEAAFGRKLPIVEVADIGAVKRARGVPADLASCHTALIHGYVVEGHVPPADIKRLVASRSRIVRGLAVPGMPMGSPGMDVGHDHKEAYSVYAFGADGRRSVFAAHG
jgi:hypothetical protein